jgi:site-specific recombinase XerD
MTHLRQRMIEDMGIRNLADNTQSAYLQQIISYAEHFHRSPEEFGPEAVRAYQLYLMNIRRLSPSSISVATGALCFLYKVTLKRDWADDQIPMPKRPFRLPVILSREEVALPRLGRQSQASNDSHDGLRCGFAGLRSDPSQVDRHR